MVRLPLSLPLSLPVVSPSFCRFPCLSLSCLPSLLLTLSSTLPSFVMSPDTSPVLFSLSPSPVIFLSTFTQFSSLPLCFSFPHFLSSPFFYPLSPLFLLLLPSSPVFFYFLLLLLLLSFISSVSSPASLFPSFSYFLFPLPTSIVYLLCFFSCFPLPLSSVSFFSFSCSFLPCLISLFPPFLPYFPSPSSSPSSSSVSLPMVHPFSNIRI